MRAMPSPTSRTRPDSLRSISVSKPWIWRLMISLISSALIMSYPLASRSRTRASCPSRLPSSMRLPTWATNPPRSEGSTVSWMMTCLPSAWPSRELLLLVLGEGHRRAHAGAHAARLDVHQIAVGLHQLGEMVHAAARGDEPQSLLHQRAAAGAPGHLHRHLLALRGLDPGPQEHGLELPVAVELGGELLQLAQEGVGGAALARDGEESLGVARRGQLA